MEKILEIKEWLKEKYKQFKYDEKEFDKRFLK